MKKLHTPGVYVEEIPSSPPSVAEVSTAIPAFLGYTENQPSSSQNKVAVRRIESMLHFEKLFGGPRITAATIEVNWETDSQSKADKSSEGQALESLEVIQTENKFRLYYAIKHYFANGGGPCYIVSVGTYPANGNQSDFQNGLDELAKEDEPTLIVLTDAATTLDRTIYYSLAEKALAQCEKLQDRFALVDVLEEDASQKKDADTRTTIESFRNTIGNKNLLYGAAYYPWLETLIPVVFDEKMVSVKALNMPNNHWATRIEGIEITSKTENSTTSFKVDPNLEGPEKVQLRFNGNHMDVVMAAPLAEDEIVSGFNEWDNKNGGKASDQGFFLKRVDPTSKSILPGAQVQALEAIKEEYFELVLGEANGIRFQSPKDQLKVQVKVAAEKAPADSTPAIDVKIDRENGVLTLDVPQELNSGVEIVQACNASVDFQTTSISVTIVGDGGGPVSTDENPLSLKKVTRDLPLELDLGGTGGWILTCEDHNKENPVRVMFDLSKTDPSFVLEPPHLILEGAPGTKLVDLVKKGAPKGWDLVGTQTDPVTTLQDIAPNVKLTTEPVDVWQAKLGELEIISFESPGKIGEELGKIGLALDAETGEITVSDVKKLAAEAAKFPFASAKSNLLVLGKTSGIKEDTKGKLEKKTCQQFAWGNLPEMQAVATGDFTAATVVVNLNTSFGVKSNGESQQIEIGLKKNAKLVDAVNALNAFESADRPSIYFLPVKTEDSPELKPIDIFPTLPIDKIQTQGSVSVLQLGNGNGLTVTSRQTGISVAIEKPDDSTESFSFSNNVLAIKMAGETAKSIAEAYQKWTGVPGVSITQKKPGKANIKKQAATALIPQAGLPFAIQLGGDKGIQLQSPQPGKVLVDSTPAGGKVEFKPGNGTLKINVPADKKAQDVVAAFPQEATKFKDWTLFQLGDGSAQFSNDLLGPLSIDSGTGGSKRDTSLSEIKFLLTGLYNEIKSKLNKIYVTLPPSAAMAGIYADVDRTRGVWKAPANVSINHILRTTVKINDELQEMMNIDATSGKSVNAIRLFPGKGNLVWGARTLAGNNNDWRYISVRRFVIMVEESIRNATAFAVFEPNTSETWLKVSSMIDSFLYGLYQQGALAGSKAKEAYYVHVGLGTTMDAQDIREGRMIVEVGLAVVRPAEFIVLKFSQKLEEA